jgi:hypothetical protein
VTTGFGGFEFVTTSVFPASGPKSTSTSARSAGARMRALMGIAEKVLDARPQRKRPGDAPSLQATA